MASTVAHKSIFEAIEEGNVALLNQLLDQQALACLSASHSSPSPPFDINWKHPEREHRTFLHQAALQCLPEVLSLLIDFPKRLEAQRASLFGELPLFLKNQASRRKEEVQRVKVDLNAADSYDRTALHMVVLGMEESNHRKRESERNISFAVSGSSPRSSSSLDLLSTTKRKRSNSSKESMMKRSSVSLSDLTSAQHSLSPPPLSRHRHHRSSSPSSPSSPSSSPTATRSTSSPLLSPKRCRSVPEFHRSSTSFTPDFMKQDAFACVELLCSSSSICHIPIVVARRDKEGKTACYLAIENGEREMALLLMHKEIRFSVSSSSSSCSSSSSSSSSSASCSSPSRSYTTTTRMMEEAQLQMWKPVHLAALRGDTNKLKKLIEERGNTELNLPSGVYAMTPLHLSVLGSYACTKVLVESGADVNRKDRLGTSVLQLACVAGSKKMVEYLLEKGAEFKSTSKTGLTPLMMATIKGRLGVASVLSTHSVASSSYLDQTDIRGMNALLHASFWDQSVVLKLLIAHGAKTDITLPSTSSSSAKRKARPSSCDLSALTSSSASNSSSTASSVRALFGSGSLRLTSKSSSKRNNINKKFATFSPIFYNDGEDSETKEAEASTSSASSNRRRVYLHPVRLREKRCRGFTALHLTAVKAQLKACNVLLSGGGIDVNVRDSHQRTALHIAAMIISDNGYPFVAGTKPPLSLSSSSPSTARVRSRRAVAKVFPSQKEEITLPFDAEEDGDESDDDEWSSFVSPFPDGSLIPGKSQHQTHTSSSPSSLSPSSSPKGSRRSSLPTAPSSYDESTNKGDRIDVQPAAHLRFVKYLLEKREADATCLDDKRRLALHYAARNNFVGTVQLILRAYRDEKERERCVNAQDINSYTPLMLACMEGNSGVALVLLKNGADPNLTEATASYTAMHFAAMRGHTTCVKILLCFNANPNSSTESLSRTPLHLAVLYEHTACVHVLCTNKTTSLNCADVDGKRPLHYCAQNTNRECALILINQGADINAMDHKGNTPTCLSAEFQAPISRSRVSSGVPIGGGRTLMQGYVSKKKRDKASLLASFLCTSFWMVVVADHLVFYRDQKKIDELGKVSLKGCQVLSKRAKYHKTFKLISPKEGKLVFVAPSSQERRQWCHILSQVLANSDVPTTPPPAIMEEERRGKRRSSTEQLPKRGLRASKKMQNESSEANSVHDPTASSSSHQLTESCLFVGTLADGKTKSGDAVLLYDDKTKFRGHFHNDEAEGDGTYDLPDGSSFKGSFKAGKMHGKGVFTLPDGSKIEGHFKEGECVGWAKVTLSDGRTVKCYYKSKATQVENNLYVTSRGNTYEGEWPQHRQPSLTEMKEKLALQVRDERNIDDESPMPLSPSTSRGSTLGRPANSFSLLPMLSKFVSKDGDVYVGQFKNGMKHGRGSYKYANGRSYQGQFKNGRKHGIGTYVLADGSRYDGGFKNGKRHGHGRYQSYDGSKYEGEFCEGKKHGYGVYLYADGSIYQGEFYNDNFHGKGKYTYSDGEFYEGDFVCDVFHGYGEYHFAAGDVYKGEYENDMMHGEGEYLFTDGRRYRGRFGEGRFNGVGKYSYPDGSYFEGTFTNDQKDGVGVYTDNNGGKWQETWSAGRRISRIALTTHSLGASSNNGLSGGGSCESGGMSHEPFMSSDSDSDSEKSSSNKRGGGGGGGKKKGGSKIRFSLMKGSSNSGGGGGGGGGGSSSNMRQQAAASSLGMAQDKKGKKGKRPL